MSQHKTIMGEIILLINENKDPDTRSERMEHYYDTASVSGKKLIDNIFACMCKNQFITIIEKVKPQKFQIN